METFDDWRPWSCAPRDQEILIRGDGVLFVGERRDASRICVNRPVEGAIVRHVDDFIDLEWRPIFATANDVAWNAAKLLLIDAGAVSRVVDNLFFRIKYEGLDVLDEADQMRGDVSRIERYVMEILKQIEGEK